MKNQLIHYSIKTLPENPDNILFCLNMSGGYNAYYMNATEKNRSSDIILDFNYDNKDFKGVIFFNKKQFKTFNGFKKAFQKRFNLI